MPQLMDKKSRPPGEEKKALQRKALFAENEK